jgi:hypothetical protein
LAPDYIYSGFALGVMVVAVVMTTVMAGRLGKGRSRKRQHEDEQDELLHGPILPSKSGGNLCPEHAELLAKFTHSRPEPKISLSSSNIQRL